MASVATLLMPAAVLYTIATTQYVNLMTTHMHVMYTLYALTKVVNSMDVLSEFPNILDCSLSMSQVSIYIYMYKLYPRHRCFA